MAVDKQDDNGRAGIAAAHTALARSWFAMTREEQRAVVLFLLLFLLGLGVQAWHAGRTDAHAAHSCRPTDQIETRQSR